jgi:hypothetical protein
MINLLTVFLSGLFGLAVAVVTFSLSTRRERTQQRRTADRVRFEKIEALYIDTIAGLEKLMRYTERMMDYSTAFDEMAHVNARLKLSAPPKILEQTDVISDLMYAWSTEYRRGQPQRMGGDLPFSMISSDQAPHREKAKELFPQLSQAVLSLVELMKNHLAEIDPDRDDLA